MIKKDLRISQLRLDDAHITFRNFGGKVSEYNKLGERSFALYLDDPDLVENLKADGWNIKYTKVRDPEDEPRAFTSIKVSFDRIPPKMYFVNERKELTPIREDQLSLLDTEDIAFIDLVINPSYWEKGRESGVKGYLRELYVSLEDHTFNGKYRRRSEGG